MVAETKTYCNWGGSSRGIRAFMESELPAFKEKKLQLQVVTELNRGQHPFLKGLYSKISPSFPLIPCCKKNILYVSEGMHMKREKIARLLSVDCDQSVAV
ncbi:hypothetical protein K7X08_001466 [Anisodus acutangulus]|uniref:Large ribosomal subunit protein mL43 n=1 Tax=Anisodus acutangulus TaxID=402998 RepID=A0A9Q1MSU6_9SOLA|nr:hypothetical protein K7X08_001466 [Anisodus acutangulus]